jgi:steroid delta-isomerase-like uncharacterized protein
MTKWLYAVGGVVAAGLLACAVEKQPPVAAGGEAILEAYIRAWNEHDSVAIDTLLAPNAIHEDPAQNFRGQGSAKVVDLMRQLVAAAPDSRLRVTNTIEDGRYVALEWTWTATYTGPDPHGKQVTKKRISGRGASFAEVEKGKIKRFTDYYDFASSFR